MNVFDFDHNRVFDYDFEEGKPVGNAIFQYNSDGLIEKIFNLDSIGSIVSEDVYVYKPAEKQIVFTSYKSKGKIDYNYTYTFAGSIENGNCIAIEHRDSVGNLVMRVTNSFDSNNMRTEKSIFNSKNELQFKFVYTYNSDKGFNTITKVNAAGEIMEIDTYSYDSKGNLTSVISKNKDGAAMEGLSYTYELF
jgi:hypothetical protein